MSRRTLLGMNSTEPAHVSASVPRSWATRSDPERGIVVAARSREVPPSGFPPELVVRTVPVDSDLATWRRDALAALTSQLDQIDVEDEDHFELGEHEVSYRRFSYRSVATDVVCEQWAWLVDGLGVTLTGSVARSDYAAWCELFEDVAGTVEVWRAGQPGRGARIPGPLAGRTTSDTLPNIQHLYIE